MRREEEGDRRREAEGRHEEGGRTSGKGGMRREEEGEGEGRQEKLGREA